MGKVTSSQGAEFTIVHYVEWSTATESTLGNTRLITKHIGEFQSSSWPSLQKITVKDIELPMYVIEKSKSQDPLPPRINSKTIQKQYIVTVIKTHSGWAQVFYDWARMRSQKTARIP
jgi:hypothetical protein